MQNAQKIETLATLMCLGYNDILLLPHVLINLSEKLNMEIDALVDEMMCNLPLRSYISQTMKTIK